MSTLWKSHNDFHEGLGNLTAEREIPTFPQPLFAFFKKKRKTKADRWRVKQEPDSSLVNNIPLEFWIVTRGLQPTRVA
jgi:hypothetical protein